MSWTDQYTGDPEVELRDVKAQLAKLTEEAAKDYKGMREMQAKFIKASQELTIASQDNEALKSDMAVLQQVINIQASRDNRMRDLALKIAKERNALRAELVGLFNVLSPYCRRDDGDCSMSGTYAGPCGYAVCPHLKKG